MFLTTTTAIPTNWILINLLHPVYPLTLIADTMNTGMEVTVVIRIMAVGTALGLMDMAVGTIHGIMDMAAGTILGSMDMAVGTVPGTMDMAAGTEVGTEAAGMAAGVTMAIIEIITVMAVKATL